MSREDYERLRQRHPERCPAIEAAPRGAPSSAQPEPPVRNDALETAPREACDAQRIAVRITSYRRRIIDPDNLTPKYFVDGLRYAALIPDDREQDISLEVRQVKVKSKEAECTIIELT